LAVRLYENHRLNVEKISAFSGLFLKRSLKQACQSLASFEGISHRLTAVIVCVFECWLWRGVDTF